MFYVYVLQSKKDNLFYTGYTCNLEKRVREHNSGREASTKPRIPFELIYYEWCLNRTDAIAREKYLKSGMGKKFVRNRIKSYLKSSKIE